MHPCEHLQLGKGEEKPCNFWLISLVNYQEGEDQKRGDPFFIRFHEGNVWVGYLNRRLSPAMWSRALLMWGILAVVSLLICFAAYWMGGFIHSNVNDELEAQQISFPPAEGMSEAELAIDGMREHAGERLTTGEGAQVYSEFILLHMNESAEEAGYPGATYATLGGIQRELRADVAAAQEAGDQAALEEVQTKLDTVTQLRNTMLTGSNLRGNLLSAYGWGNVGDGVTYVGFGFGTLFFLFALLFVYEWRNGHLPEAEAEEDRY